MDGNKIVENKLNDLRSVDGGKDFPSSGPHPVILSPRSNPTEEFEPQLTESSSFEQFPTSMYEQQQPDQSPGVIVSRPQQQEQQQEEQKAVQQQQQQQSLEHDPPISLPSQPEPSLQFESNNPADQTDCSEPPTQQKNHSGAETTVSETSKESQLSSNKVMPVGSGQARRDSDGHSASPAVRAIVANKILHRNRSLSDSIDSRKSEAWSEAPATPPLTPVGPPDHQHHFQTSENGPDQVCSLPSISYLDGSYFQLMAVNEEERETTPSPPPPAPPTPEPVPSHPGEIIEESTPHLSFSDQRLPHMLNTACFQMKTGQSVTTVVRVLAARQQLRAT
jgi:hypothetical protein